MQIGCTHESGPHNNCSTEQEIMMPQLVKECRCCWMKGKVQHLPAATEVPLKPPGRDTWPRWAFSFDLSVCRALTSNQYINGPLGVIKASKCCYKMESRCFSILKAVMYALCIHEWKTFKADSFFRDSMNKFRSNATFCKQTGLGGANFN